MKSVSFVNMKGGVAKTTMAVNIADCLATRHKLSVLVIDIDPQFNATQCVVSGENYKKHLDNQRHTVVDIFDDSPRPVVGVVAGAETKEPLPIELIKLGSSFFLIINGCYKAAEQVLRSSIENFIKAHGSLEYSEFHKIKNVYEVIDKSGKSSFFSSEVGRIVHEKLKEMYGDLCSTVHTGREHDMQKISALGDFPAIDSKRSALVCKRYLKIVRLYVSSLSVLFKSDFHKMHHKNKDIVELSLIPEALQALHVT